MSSPPQGDQGPQPGGGASPGGQSATSAPAAGSAPAPPVDPGVVVQQLATALSLLAANQQDSSVREAKFVKAPDVFAPKTLDEELAGWPDWSFCFRNWLSVQDGAFRDDLLKVEKATEILAFADYESGTKARSIRLYSILATYLRNRPLRLLRSVADGDGFRVWRSLVDELQPSSRPRALALAQALVKFPPYKEGGSLLDYTLAFERLLTEYAKVAPHPYHNNLKISTLLAGLPSDVRKYLELNMDDSMTYEKLRTRLLQYERTTAGWSSEHVLRSVGIDKDSKFLDTSDVVPMEVDRVEKGKGKKGFGKKGTGKKGDNNYYQKGKVVHEQPNDINLVIFETPQTPTCEFFDLACEDDDWDDYFDEPDEYQVRAVELCAGSALEVEAEAEAELQSSSTLVFDIAESDEDSDCEHDVRMVSEQPMQHEFEQVILDSGADVTVLPLSHGAVGEPNANNTMIRDAQGNVIPMASYRKNVVFEVEGNEGQRLFFRDKVVVAQVKQPLLSVGKLIRDHWSLGDVDGRLQMSKGGNSFPVHMSRNSLAANMKIYRLEEHVRAVVIELSELMESGTEIQGWSLSPDGGPMHVSTSSSCTVDPSLVFPSQQWPFRTTLLSQGDRRYEVFESGEYWEDRKTLSTERPATKVVTILSAAPVEPRDIGKVIVNEQFRPEYIVPEEAPAHDDGDAWMAAAPERVPDSPPAQVDGQRGGGAEEQGDPVGPEVHLAAGRQATLVVNDVELTEDSSLKVLRRACQFLRVSKNGSKAVLWSRLQSEVADSQLRHSVQAADAVLEAYRREPQTESGTAPPDAETVALHEVTHCPRMPWCNACVASRSREDNHSASTPKELGVIHFDYMFNKTEAAQGSPEHPMAVHVVMVDEHTNFVQCVPVESKSAEHVRVAVDEAVKMASLLGHTNLTLRGDSEPAMKAFMAAIVQARTRLGLATKVTYAAPDSSLHQGLKAERFIGIVRGLAKTLLRTIEERTGFQVQSGHPVYVWAFRHSAFLYSRFHVQRDGMTAFELVHSRPYAGKLCAFGSSVFSQYLPHAAAKGSGWKRSIFLGKSTLGNLNIVADSSGVHYARTMRKGALGFESELIASAKGVPWNATLDVLPTKRSRAPRIRAPALIEPVDPVVHAPGPGPDEAASDPTSPSASQGSASSAGGVGSMSTSSSSSAEMMTDAEMGQASAHRVDGGDPCEAFARRVREDQPCGHEPEVIPETDMDLSFEDGVEKEEDEDPNLEAKQAAKEWAHRRYEDGPPELSEEYLCRLDAAMDALEVKRLLALGVVRKLGDNQQGGNAPEGMKKLQSRFVRDWRFRGNCWIRRSRLVAKEFKFLEPELEHLYAPASMAVLQRVFAGLCASGENLVLYSVDVSDAYLQVPQSCPTCIISNDGEYLELLYSLPGQRDAARGWYLHLKEIVKGNRLRKTCVQQPCR
ncbi:unnamed protein product [Symbiodinium sp. CCMP2592]|nr:unnamed protein product [Symbiodinium sp. CCMP2592]